VIDVASTLFCTEEGGIAEKAAKYRCRLISDGKRVGEWTVNRVEIISEEGKEIDTDVESDTKSLIASTDDYFNCEVKEGTLKCIGSVKMKAIAKKVEKKEISWWERIFGGD
jgi:hypothetical protein